MLMPPTADEIKESLKRLRRGYALARPTTVLTALAEPVQTFLSRGQEFDTQSPGHVEYLAHLLHRTVRQLAEGERLYLEVDLNLRPEHRYATLTDRQESLAQQLKCAVKTVRRRSDQAMDTLVYLLLTESPTNPDGIPLDEVGMPFSARPPSVEPLHRFLGLHRGASVDIVCSEIPPEERPDYAAPEDRNYLRYAKFADLDTLIFARTKLAQLAPTAVVRDFAPSEYYSTGANVLMIIGGPPWNAKYREFLPQLPFHFDPHPLGQDDPLVISQLSNLTLSPRWTLRGELIEDLAVLTRITLQSTTVFLLGGCLTLGVLGAARCLLDSTQGTPNFSYLTDQVGDDDFVVVTEARRVGGITDIVDLTTVEPLLLMSRPTGADWEVLADNTKRFTRDGRRTSWV
ncbi:hypothetical protein [Nocardia camponoti]|uniref:Uncharacterized protein n=1 Tax=Nocardia camponoti TaxID=1616106 RepID=A0A917QC22_9NOCA|nr:hypothetical protein [Nocardia camponoti]GGK43635.1 hypothetical protein GCM10011591_14070 [Nocardia camponoti]